MTVRQPVFISLKKYRLQSYFKDRCTESTSLDSGSIKISILNWHKFTLAINVLIKNNNNFTIYIVFSLF
jgi:hypothetical protein